MHGLGHVHRDRLPEWPNNVAPRPSEARSCSSPRVKSPEVQQLLLILAQATFFVPIASFRVAACTWIWRALACSATGTVSRSTPFS